MILMGTLLLISGTCLAAEGGPAAARQPLAADGQMILSPSDRCPVCAMFPARHPQTAAAMTLSSGETFYFCTNGCLLRTWLRPGFLQQADTPGFYPDWSRNKCIDY